MAFSFGSTAPNSSSSSGGFTFGGGSNPAPASNFSFGNSAATTNSSSSGSGFSFGAAPANTAASGASGFSFGSAASSDQAAAGTTNGGANFSFGGNAASGTGSGGTSFSFGAQPTTAPSSEKSSGLTFGGAQTASTGSTAPASGFSFGATTAATGTDKPATTGSTAPASGFSFGATPAATGTDKPATTGSTAPASGFSFGAASAGSDPAKGDGDKSAGGKDEANPATGSSTSSALPAAEYSAMDVKSIMQQWYKDLAQDAAEFEKQAKRVATWDQQLRENQKTLEDTVDNVHRIMTSQTDLKTACDSIEAYQADLDADITSLTASLDAELKNIEQQEQQLVQEPTEDDFEREKAFVLAEDLNQTLNQMEFNLKRVVDELNKSRGLDSSNKDAGGDGSSATVGNPIAKIVQVLNHHHESLAWLDDKARSMQRDIAVVKQELSYRTTL